MGGCVPDGIERSLSPPPRGTEIGTQQLVVPAMANLDQHLVAILSNSDRFVQALDRIQDGGTVNETDTRLLQHLSKEAKEQWSIKALGWICFIFPCHEVWEHFPSYTSVVRSLYPHLENMLRSVRRTKISPSLRVELSEALLAASRVKNLRSSALSLVASLLNDGSPLHLQAESVVQQSILCRLEGGFKNSERIIDDFRCRCESPKPTCLPTFYQHEQKHATVSNRRLNAIFGVLHRWHLENLVQCDDYELAKEQIDHWQLAAPASPMELRILPSIASTTSKIFRSQGSFECARQHLELCVKVLHQRDSIRARVLCQLADVYKDLGFPDLASELLGPKVEKERKKTIRTKAYRRFLVIGRCQLTKAKLWQCKNGY
jgi:hypothetical protein